MEHADYYYNLKSHIRLYTVHTKLGLRSYGAKEQGEEYGENKFDFD
jgi:hypothetical protein